MGPLTGIRILDLSRLLPGPFCTRMLADMGAEVIKIEEPVRGDYAREFVPRRGDFACWFMEVNRNKKSVALDLKQESARRTFFKLVETADVVVESFRPGVLQKLGVDFAAAKQRNPKIVYCSITGYGPQGPLVNQADHDIGYQSLAGLVSLSGEKDGKPAIPGTLLADMQASSIAGMSILAALYHAQKTGQGQEISISLFDVCLVSAPLISVMVLSVKGEITGLAELHPIIMCMKRKTGVMLPWGAWNKSSGITCATCWSGRTSNR